MRYRILFTLVSLLLFLHLFPAAPSRAQGGDDILLSVTKEDGSAALLTSLAEGACFAIRFRHSVARSIVEEWFCRRDTSLYLEKTKYHDFGAGLPYKPDSGQTMRFESGSIIIEGFHREFLGFTLRVGRIANHALLYYDEKQRLRVCPLNSLAPAGAALTFSLIRAHATHSSQQ